MPRLPQLTAKELEAIIEKLGFKCVHTVGSHRIYRHDDGRKTVIPFHSGDVVGPGLLIKIVKKDLGLSRDDFLALI